MKIRKLLVAGCFLLLFLSSVTAASASEVLAEEWNLTFEGVSGGYYQIPCAVQETQDGGYILAGDSGAEAAYSSVWMMKVNSKGKEEWSNFFDEDGYIYDEYRLLQTSDGGYVLAGIRVIHDSLDWFNSSSYPWMVKANSNGTEEWNRIFGNGESGSIEAIQKADDGGYIITGNSITSSDADTSNIGLIKTDSSGVEEWNRTMGNSSDFVSAIQKTEDGGFILAGHRNNFSETGATDVKPLLIKIDSEGNAEWNKTIEWISLDIFDYNDEKINLNYNAMDSLRKNADGGYVLTGTSRDASGNENAVLIKMDSNGDLEWSRNLGNESLASSVKETSDGGYIVGGEIHSLGTGYYGPSDAWLIKTYSNGTEEWNMTIEGPADEDASVEQGINSVQETSDKGYILAGRTDYSGTTRTDGWLVKLSGEKNETVGEDNETGQEYNDTDGKENETIEVKELQKCTSSLKNIDNRTRTSLNSRIEEITCYIENGEEERAVCKLKELIELINEMNRSCELNSNQAAALIEKTQRIMEAVEK